MEDWNGMDGRKGRMEVRIRALGLRSILTCNGMAWHGTYGKVLGRKEDRRWRSKIRIRKNKNKRCIVFYFCIDCV